MPISKSELLNGAKECKEVSIGANNGDTIFIRKLSDGEVARVTAIMAKGGRVSQKGSDKDGNEEISMDAEQAIGNVRKAKHTAIAWALTNGENPDKWTAEEVSKLPVSIVEEMAQKVVEYSGVENKRQFEKW